MSFSAIRSIATSSLAVTQMQTALTSANIANADTQGYTRKVATQSAVNTGTVGAGVSITAVTSTVDKYLLQDLVAATSTLGAAATTASYADKLQTLLGSTTGSDSGGTSLANSLADLETALTALSGTPESATLQASSIAALDTLASQLRETSDGIQGLRADADNAIEQTVATINDTLNAMEALNDRIAGAQSRGEPTADLEDQRNTALQTLSEQMEIRYYVTADNQMRITTTSGTTLLDGSVHELSYSSAAAVTSATVFEAISVNGKDITAQLGSGTLGALVEQRDSVLPAAQAELDELATALIATLNGIHNAGTSLPPPSSLTGSTLLSSGDAFSGSGTTRFAVTDADGALVSYADLDLSDYTTVGDLVSAIDAIDGLSATLDAAGRLVVSANDATNGVAIADIDGVAGDADQGLSDYLGLNDLLTGSDASTIAVRSSLLATPGLLATSALSAEDAPAIGDTVVSVGESRIGQALAAALSGDHDFTAAGSLKASSGSFADYAARIIAGVAATAQSSATALETSDSAQQSLADSLSSQSGVNLDEETAKLSELEQQYAVAAQLLETLNTMFDTLLRVAASA
ncbi:MAG TPA: flagellar hook-associated protein FlgK [Bosea sp. (in: a-proteobacteria)]|jgi:flagellar hook-associated protein 1 FlgK|uniref:flagellar hook-associated protein FlgK n=1 Tax=Bosea sp. (in: a-proteobacteria) TaxID=1871050 RepID=UPI002DDD32E1|nr:flagellar hook-associated protein FlgK [Bosea sp. (in: a-proteobacteria)]HEV2555708.1 flagellar hook-associated protein FlgK [Bosea sp. (in: a-proteobacteria)]